MMPYCYAKMLSAHDFLAVVVFCPRTHLSRACCIAQAADLEHQAHVAYNSRTPRRAIQLSARESVVG